MKHVISLKQFVRRIRTHGIEFLLPHNLDEISLQQLLLEATSIEEDLEENIEASTLLVAILHLKEKKILKPGTRIPSDPDAMMKYFDLYITQLRIEKEQRTGNIVIEDSSLANIDNIFDSNRKIVAWTR